LLQHDANSRSDHRPGDVFEHICRKALLQAANAPGELIKAIADGLEFPLDRIKAPVVVIVPLFKAVRWGVTVGSLIVVMVLVEVVMFGSLVELIFALSGVMVLSMSVMVVPSGTATPKRPDHHRGCAYDGNAGARCDRQAEQDEEDFA
jgi:hypothetical protein